MYLRNFLKPGQCVEFVPFGAEITIQYNSKGVIERVTERSRHGAPIEKLKEFIAAVQSYKTVPQSISAKNGKTWVRGVLYTSKDVIVTGKLPDAAFDEYLNLYLENPTSFNFFAYAVESTAVTVGKNMSAINQWLKMLGFRTLEGFIVSGDPSNIDKQIKHYLVDNYNFRANQVAEYLIFDGDDYNFISANMSGHIVKRVCQVTGPTGHLSVRLECDDVNISCSYQDVVKFNINTNTYIITDSNAAIVYATATDNKKRDKRTDTMKCSCCGRIIKIENNKPVICPDPNCKSRMYTEVHHMCNVLKIPVISVDQYDHYFKDSKVIMLSEIFNLPEYESLQVETTFSDLLDSLVPVSVVRDRTIFRLFVNNCTNDMDTIRHYIHNPDQILSDIQSVRASISCKDFINWLKASINVRTIEELLDSSNIIIVLQKKAFEGSPILRGQTIYVTGKFKHGNINKLTGILSSYAAVVTTEFTQNVSLVVVGDRNEDVAGYNVRKAKDKKIPVFTESEFFARYEIDEDLNNNLQ